MSLEFGQLLLSLKAAIKAKGFTYQALAKELGMSEAGVKRLLNAKDCSLQRLLKICRVIGVSLNDLIAISDGLDEETQDFNEAQVNLFQRSPLSLKFYYKLRVERCSAKEIEEQMGLSAKECQRILFDLDKVNLIKLLPGNKIDGLGRRGVRWRKAGQAMLDMKYDFTADLLRFFQQGKNIQEGYYPVYHLKLSDHSRDELYRELDALVDKYAKVSGREGIALKKENIRPLNMAFLLAPIWGFQKKP